MASRTDIQYIRFYTAGSAAKKLEPVAPVQDTIRLPELKKKPRRKVVFLDPVALLGMTVAVCMLICMTVGIFQTWSSRQELQEMEQYVTSLTEENTALRSTYTAGYDLRQVEQTALALGMIPAEQARQISIQVSPMHTEQTVALWESLGNILAGLIA